MFYRPATLDKIASFICGDSPLPFPYRSSSKLTSFFTGLDLDYIHYGETRNKWVRDCLTDISRQGGEVGRYPSSSEALQAVIEEVMNPAYFDEAASDSNLEEALVLINKVLMPYQLEIAFDKSRWECNLVSTDGRFISTAHRSPEKVTKITFSPRVFEVPNLEPHKNLVAIMMPFGGFDGVHKAIKAACTEAGLESRRADDIWDNDTILQDIFDLIYAAEIVIADFSGKNPNVMYETGVAHTLGKHVIPITQTLEHVPSNLHGHRALPYVGANSQGLRALTSELAERLKTLRNGPSLGVHREGN